MVSVFCIVWTHLPYPVRWKNMFCTTSFSWDHIHICKLQIGYKKGNYCYIYTHMSMILSEDVIGKEALSLWNTKGQGCLTSDSNGIVTLFSRYATPYSSLIYG